MPHPSQSYREGWDANRPPSPVFAVVVEIAGLQPGVKSPAEAEATDLIAFAVALLFFFKFSPKIACQVPKPLKSLKTQELALAF